MHRSIKKPLKLSPLWLLSPAMILLLLAASGPLLIVVVYSFLERGDYGGVVWTFSWQAWQSVFLERDIFDGTLGWSEVNLTVLFRSIKLSLLTTFATLIFGFPTAYFIATRPKSQRNVWLLLLMVPFWINILVRTFAIFELIRNEGAVNTLLLNLHIIDTPISMMYTDFAVTLGMVYVYLPLMALPIYSLLERLDFRLVEAAFDLYASRFAVLRHVIIPLAKPGIIAGSILVFVPCLGAYVTPRLLGGGKSMMLGNLIELQFGSFRNWPLGSAMAMTLLLIVSVSLFFYVRQMRRTEETDG